MPLKAIGSTILQLEKSYQQRRCLRRIKSLSNVALPRSSTQSLPPGNLVILKSLLFTYTFNLFFLSQPPRSARKYQKTSTSRLTRRFISKVTCSRNHLRHPTVSNRYQFKFSPLTIWDHPIRGTRTSSFTLQTKRSLSPAGQVSGMWCWMPWATPQTPYLSGGSYRPGWKVPCRRK